jgi:hypothetical protein
MVTPAVPRVGPRMSHSYNHNGEHYTKNTEKCNEKAVRRADGSFVRMHKVIYFFLVCLLIVHQHLLRVPPRDIIIWFSEQPRHCAMIGLTLSPNPFLKNTSIFSFWELFMLIPGGDLNVTWTIEILSGKELAVNALNADLFLPSQY